jgi:hypothetical protein
VDVYYEDSETKKINTFNTLRTKTDRTLDFSNRKDRDLIAIRPVALRLEALDRSLHFFTIELGVCKRIRYYALKLGVGVCD